MIITELLQGATTSLPIDETIEIPKDIYKDNEIIKLDPVNIKGELTYFEEKLTLNAIISGTMVIPDSVSLEEVSYPFSCEIEEDVTENLKKDENRLDILAILWENILLEIPMHYSLVTNYEQFSGDGWKVISEDEYQGPVKENPFKDLL